MGTRADFYVGRGESAEWLGSIAWDGDPASVFGDVEGFLGSDPDGDWRKWVSTFLAAQDDATLPGMGWPWPWEDSRTTDYAYALDEGRIWCSGFGREWFALNRDDEYMGEPDRDLPKTAAFPNMKDRQRVAHGNRSGLLVFGAS